MPENNKPVLATMAACIMASTYQDVISCCGCSGVPLLYGACKSEALKCGLAILELRALIWIIAKPLHHTSLMFSSRQIFPLPLMTSMRGSQDIWEEVIIDVYNNTPRGTRSYSSEIFCTLPVISANWCSFTQVIQIPIVEHSDQPNASTLYSTLANSSSNVSASVRR